ncbi:hypothetical protein BBFGKLBO_03064 [Synechococcus sp. CBW1107]|nr:hypothetical protein BBFGKLBO_03064 [Synechococcus sp. CBW1107]
MHGGQGAVLHLPDACQGRADQVFGGAGRYCDILMQQI